MENLEQKQPEKGEEAPKKRQIIIDIIGDNNIKLSSKSEHASVFELIAVLNSMIQTFNVKQEEK